MTNMRSGLFFQKLKYHYKRYLSILFASIGLALLVGAFTYFAILNHNDGYAMFAGVWNYVILFVSFIFILVGSIKGTGLVYSGILIFIFYLLWDFGYYILTLTMNGGFLMIFQGSWYSILLNVGYVACAIAALVVGIFLYIRLRQFIIGRYSSYVGLRTLVLIFMILVIVTYGFRPALLFVNAPSADVFIAILDPLAIISEAVSTFFIITRLKSSY